MQSAERGTIRKACLADSEVLTNLSFASKRYWNYPEAFFTVWRSELTITKDYLRRNEVFVHEHHGELDGYYSLVTLDEPLPAGDVVIPEGTWLEHMFVRPESIGRGIGRLLFTHLHLHCGGNGVRELQVLADPHARGFYEKMGCSYRGEFPSSIAGRTTPWLSLDCGSTDRQVRVLNHVG